MADGKGIQRNVYLLGAASFLNDVSSEMIFPLIPLFVTTILGASAQLLGLIEGVADSAASLMDIFVGYFSDRAGERKKFVFLGYGLSSATKIGIALSTTWWHVLLMRGTERVGKSIRTSPRDAMIAESTPKELRGKAFGLHRAMDTAGAIAGPLIALAILSAIGSTEPGYRAVFYAALIPAFLAVLVILLFVREPKKAAAKAVAKRPSFWESLRQTTHEYRAFLSVSALFSLSYFSFAFLIIRAADLGVSAQDVLLMYVLYNVVYALSSIPGGMLSDRVGRKPVIAGAFLVYAAVCLGFAFATSWLHAALLFALYGVFVALDESVNKAYISDLVTTEKRGISLGAYNTLVGAVYLPASIVAGALWAAFGPVTTFLFAAIIAAVSAIGLLVACR